MNLLPVRIVCSADPTVCWDYILCYGTVSTYLRWSVFPDVKHGGEAAHGDPITGINRTSDHGPATSCSEPDGKPQNIAHRTAESRSKKEGIA